MHRAAPRTSAACRPAARVAAAGRVSPALLAVCAVAAMAAWWLLRDDAEARVRAAHEDLALLLSKPAEQSEGLPIARIRRLESLFADACEVTGDADMFAGTHSPQSLVQSVLAVHGALASAELSFGEILIAFPDEATAVARFSAVLTASDTGGESLSETRSVVSRMQRIDGDWLFVAFDLDAAAPAAAAVAIPASAQEPIVTQDDPYLWLEEVEGERALDWAREQNERTLAVLEAHPLYEPILARNLEILNSDERIPTPSQMGGFVYNFWRDAEHVRGIWRRTGIESFREAEPDWETVIDLDRLAAEENENWVWSRASCRYPDYDRCLIALSRGGADAVVVREFELATKAFVDGGFELPEAKSDVAWRDRDSLFVGTDFGPGSLTDSGYARIVKIWRRGTPLAAAETVFEGAPADVGVDGLRFWDGEAHRDIVRRTRTFYNFEYRLHANGELTPLALPDDAELIGLFGSDLLVALKSDWTRGDATLPQGALVAVDLDSMSDGQPGTVEILFEPSERSSLASSSRTQSAVVLNILDNVVSRVEILNRDGSGWRRRSLETPGTGSIELLSSELTSDRFYFGYTGFLTPPGLYEADAAAATSRRVKSQPDFFDATGMSVEQLEATSADGTSIPYFVVKPRGFRANGENPTLLYGYGGFEISETPAYSATVGSAWLERGGVYVVANIRGGGEFGPSWHQAALKQNRQRAFDDFIGVAEDLIARGITSPQRLGIRGGSNGGLLVGAVFVQRPDLFNAVVCQVPLLDMRRYHRLLAGASWMAEFGNPDDTEEWAYISRYSPYQNVSADAEYPEVYFFTSTRDDRVHPAHARKMVARMREQGHAVLYYENIEGGHGGAANLNQSALNQALAYAYLHARLMAPLAAAPPITERAARPKTRQRPL